MSMLCHPLPSSFRAGSGVHGALVAGFVILLPIVPTASEAAPMDTQPAWTLEANREGAFLGMTVAAAGDVDADGYDDVLAVAPYYENGESLEGAVFLFRGGAPGGTLAPDWTFEGDRPRAFLYWAAGAGDVNGDGYDDVIVGDPYWPDETQAIGRALVFLGSATGLGGTPAWVVEGKQTRQYLGARIGPAGDVNHDGLADIAVSGSGVVLVYLGTPEGPAPDPAWSVTGLLPSDSGRGPAPIDANGDGFDDLLIASLVGTSQQILSLYRGYPLGLRPKSHQDLALPAGGYGVAFAPAGDTDGDGTPEIVLGRPGLLEVPHGSPCCPGEPVYLFEAGGQGLRDPGALVHMTPFHRDLVAPGLDGAGDLDADGFDDVLVTEYAVDLNPGGFPPIRVLVFAGGPGGLSPAPVLTLLGTQALDGFGEAAARAGDFDGDGHEDLVVGAPRHDDGEMNEGAAFVFRGGDLPTP